MKSLKHFVFISSIFMSFIAAAQVPQQINYQAVARNAAGLILANQSVSVRFTIHDISTTGTIDYQETQTGLSTNQFGLFTTAIGTGSQVGSNTFASINWGTNAKYLQVELDPAGGTNYVDMGTGQLNAVPYALNSASSAQWYTSGNDIYNLNTNTTHILGTPTGTTLRIDNSGAQDIAQFHNHSNTYAGYIGIKNDTTGMDIGTANGNTTGTFNLVTDGATRVTITHTGLTGIGTTTPLAKLDIEGNIKIHDGTQGLGKVLTSDANGLASWTAPTPTVTIGYYMIVSNATFPSSSSPYSGPVLGQIIALTGYSASTPNNLMLCDGQLLQISQYSILFQLIGTTYGGNGTSNFALPNLMGATIVGQ